MPFTREREIYQCFLPPSKDPTVTERPENGAGGGVGGLGGVLCGSPGSGETAGQREEAVYPHFSFHPLFASSPFLTAFRWLPVSRQMQKGEVDTELIFASFLKGGRCKDPSADNTASTSQKLRCSFLLPHPHL